MRRRLAVVEEAGAEGTLPQVRDVPVVGGHLPVVELGDPSGPPAVLLSGLSDGLAPVTDARTREMLRDLPLPMERFRCLALSYREPIRRPVTTRRLATDVAHVLQGSLDGPAIIVGHSMGAMVAQHLAVDAPHLVRALVMSAAVGRADDDLRAVLARWDALLLSGDVRAFARDAVLCSFTGDEVERRLDALEEEDRPRAVPAVRVQRHLALSDACATHDALERVHAIGCPALLLTGEDDLVAPPEHARRLAERIDGSELRILEGLGHAFPEQDPDRFEALVTAFLAELPPRTIPPGP